MFPLVITAIAAFAAERTLTTLADKVHDRLLDEASERFVGAVVQSHSEQLALLRGIDSKVDALLEGDFRAGLEFLRSAAQSHRSPEQRGDDLGKARDRFFDALGREGGNPSRAAAIRLQLGLTYVALDQWIDAEDSFERAYLAALEATHGRARDSLFGYKNEAGVVIPLLDQIREARIALGALPTSVPVFRLGTWGSFALRWVSYQLKGDAAPFVDAPEVYRFEEVKAHPESRLFRPLPPEMEDSLLHGIGEWPPEVLREPFWEYLSLLPTATNVALAKGVDDVQCPLHPEAVHAIQGAIGHPFPPYRYDAPSDPGVRQRYGLAPSRSHSRVPAQAVAASEVVAERRANWPPRHRQRAKSDMFHAHLMASSRSIGREV